MNGVLVTLGFLLAGPIASARGLGNQIGPGVLETLLPEVIKVPERLDIPVSWRQTRARIRSSGTSTQTESFRETWRLSSDGSGGGWLESRRAKVRVLKRVTAGAVPFSLIIEEKALGQLIGIIKSQWTWEEIDGGAPSIFQLDLSSPGHNNKLVIHFSDEERYTVQLQIGQIDLRPF